MRVVKSDRLKKLEVELQDLEQWLKLGLVPKKDVKKHEDEIKAVKAKIQEELDRLQFLRESGDSEDQQAPKRNATRTGFTDMPTIPDIDMQETAAGFTEAGMDTDNDTSIGPSTTSLSSKHRDDDDDDDDDDNDEATESDEDFEEEKDEESYFSDRNRWRRGGIVDPDADEW